MAFKYGSYNQWVKVAVRVFHPALREVASGMLLEKNEVRRQLFYLGRKGKGDETLLQEFLEKHFQELFEKKISQGLTPEQASEHVKLITQFYYEGDPLHPGVTHVDAYYAGGRTR